MKIREKVTYSPTIVSLCKHQDKIPDSHLEIKVL